MIIVTRLNGSPVALNCDLIERAEANPDLVLTLVDGTKYVLLESMEGLVNKIREYRASVIALAEQLEVQLPTEQGGPASVLHLVPGAGQEV